MGQSQVETSIGVLRVVQKHLPEGFEGIRVTSQGEAAVTVKNPLFSTGRGNLVQSFFDFLPGISGETATPGPRGKPGHADGVFLQKLSQLD